MKNFQIIPVPENVEDKLLPSLHILDNGRQFAIVWADGKITFSPQLDYFLEELEYLIQIGKMFYTFFNNIKSV